MKDALPIRYEEICLPLQARESRHKAVPLHWHTFYEIELFCGGSAIQQINGRNYIMEKGMISVMTPRDFHQYTGDYRLKKFIFRENYISDDIIRLLLNPSQPHIVSLGDRFEPISLIFDQIIAHIRAQDIPTQLRLRNLVESVCIEIISCSSLTDVQNGHSPLCVGDYGAQLHTVLTYIDGNFRKPICLSDAAEAVHLSPNYFSRWFRQTLGTTFSDYIQHKRIRYASMLLLSTELSVEEIAWQSGYCSVSFFNRTFRKQYDLTPFSYRARFAAKNTSGEVRSETSFGK